MRLALTFALATAAALAQDKPATVDPRWFLPADHEHLVCLDLGVVRETELLDAVENSMLGPFFTLMEQELGFGLAQLDRITWVHESAVGEPGAGGWTDVVLYEGNQPLGEAPGEGEGWKSERVGATDVWFRTAWQFESWLWPRPEVKVVLSGSEERVRDRVEAGLRKVRRRGAPCADLMSLLAERTKPLAVVAGSFSNRENKQLLKDLLPDVTWPEGDAPKFAAMRLVLGAEAEDRHVLLRCTVRHATDGAGMAVTRRLVDDLLAKGKKDRRLSVVNKVLRGAEVRSDGIDLHVILDFGRERDAAGILTTAMAAAGALFAFEVEEPRAEVQIVGETVPQQVEEPPPPPQQPGGQGGGNGGG